jgi:nucleotide-binding universal stress UspA family protein
MPYAIKAILVPYDFSEIAEEGLNTAVHLAKRHNARLIVLHVVEYTQYVAAQSAVMGQVILANQELREIAEEKLKTMKAKLSGELNIETTIKEGPVGLSAVEEAINQNADLLVAGTHGASGFREFFIGSNAYKFVKQMPCPVLTIPPGNAKASFDKILFPVRVKSGGIEKYDFTRQFIDTNDSTLIIVVYSESEDQQKNVQTAEAERLKQQLEKEGIKHEVHWKITKNISEDVLVQSTERRSDLIVVTSTLDYEMKDFFVGPYAQQIVNHASVPVLSIRPALVFGI